LNRDDFQIRARFRRAIKAAGVRDGSRLLVAVSGGCDSVSLLYLCLDEVRPRGWRLAVGHVDHALRPDSRADADWVRDQAATLELPFFRGRIDPLEYRRRRRTSLEEMARKLRRRCLLDLARAAGADWILLGHTLDDQAETVLLNLLRGAGLRGLRGMAPCRPPWLRPLLALRREDLRSYARRRGLTWREDPSNQDPAFRRNRLRLRIMPLLESEFSPGAIRSLVRAGGTLGPVQEFLEEQADAAFSRVCLEEVPGRIRLERAGLASYHQAVKEEIVRRTCVRLRGTARDLQRAHVDALIQLLRSGRSGEIVLAGDLRVVADRRELRFLHPNRSGKQKDES